jgi:hypothetical protein
MKVSMFLHTARGKSVAQQARCLTGVALASWLSIAGAQSTLGELLNSGAKKLTVDDFKEEVVQRILVGATNSGGTLEMIYARTGVIDGRGSGVSGANIMAPVSGTWTTADNGTVCTSMRIGVNPGIMLPPRCQFWFKLADAYFVSDSDSDARTKVLRRAIKQ